MDKWCKHMVSQLPIHTTVWPKAKRSVKATLKFDQLPSIHLYVHPPNESSQVPVYPRLCTWDLISNIWKHQASGKHALNSKWFQGCWGWQEWRARGVPTSPGPAFKNHYCPRCGAQRGSQPTGDNSWKERAAPHRRQALCWPRVEMLTGFQMDFLSFIFLSKGLITSCSPACMGIMSLFSPDQYTAQ